jgi:acetyltransferase EpsM
MTPRPLVIVGGGEHARVVAEAAAGADTWRVVGYTDPDPGHATGPLQAVPHLGDDATYAAALRRATGLDRPSLVLGFRGTAEARDRATDAYGSDATWATVVHARAWVSPSATLEPGVVVLAGAIVSTGATIGRHGIVNTNTVVEHDVVVGPGTHVAPGAVIGGGTRIGRDVTIGLGASIRDHVTIGDGAVVGMGAVVVDDVAAEATVVGVPARATARATATR